MIGVIRKQELETLIAMMIEEGSDAADIIRTVKDTIIETEKELQEARPFTEEDFK